MGGCFEKNSEDYTEVEKVAQTLVYNCNKAAFDEAEAKYRESAGKTASVYVNSKTKTKTTANESQKEQDGKDENKTKKAAEKATADRMKTNILDYFDKFQILKLAMEKLPLCQPLDFFLSSPEEWIHLRWIPMKGVERLDGVISVLSQLRWGRHYGHGEVKIAEPTDNTYVLAWDLCHLAYFNKCLINHTSTKAAFAFQVKELAFAGLYTMCEITNIQIPKSIDQLHTMVTRRSLRRLLQVAHVSEKVTKQKQEVEEAFASMKRVWPKF
ncbi:hypothetical protein EC973_001358 [Apophysomyces ossiformis]|uniref:Uncharacterized protein n=1 Tax=Apophysomyces ossiformis TaxID=679940 RepID=A0A8H7BU58_9FUNG|nr:hypothetical protein EC973_001358 [Apophysomyces ossiformis]